MSYSGIPQKNEPRDFFKEYFLNDDPSPFDVMFSEARIKQNEVILESIKEKCELEADLRTRLMEFKYKQKPNRDKYESGRFFHSYTRQMWNRITYIFS